ncbi:hypothetical protein ACRQ5Q_41085 (plasmid) [Bradyrhizobium sp. PMVTL-01]|uniref:hypothetical protein n=1 Tax=Bradyrhizobium sp. PMVTL-01 TaxID=3434999 RepID=UPI003F709BE0
MKSAALSVIFLTALFASTGATAQRALSSGPSGDQSFAIKPAELENSVGVIVGTFNKDPNDESWKDDEAIKAYRAFFDRYLAGSDIINTSYLTGYQQGMLLEQILKRRRPLAREHHQAGEVAEELHVVDSTAGHPDQHQRSQQHGLDATAASALDREPLGAGRWDS